MDPATIALIAGIAGPMIGGLLGGNKSKTVGSNIPDIIKMLSSIGFGSGSFGATGPSTTTTSVGNGIKSGTYNPWFGPTAPINNTGTTTQTTTTPGDPGFQIPNLLSMVQAASAKNAPELSNLQRLIESSFGTNMGALNSLTNQVKGTANATRTRALGQIDNSTNDVQTSLARQLQSTIQGIFKQSDAGAASRGIKSAATSSKAAGQATTQANSVFDMIAKIKAGAGEAKAGIEQNTGSQLLNALMSMGQFGITANSQLTSDHVKNIMSMLSAQDANAQAPQRTLLDLIHSFPVSGGQVVTQPNWASQFGNALSGVGSTVAGYNTQQNNQNIQNQFLPLILKMLRGGGGASGGGGYGMGVAGAM